MSTKLYNVNDGVTGRDGGPYLDDEIARIAEKVRAHIEDREPDLDNPPATAGHVLVTAAKLVEGMTVNNVPSQDAAYVEAMQLAVETLVDDNDNNLRQYAEIPDEVFEEPEPEPEEESSESEPDVAAVEDKKNEGPVKEEEPVNYPPTSEGKTDSGTDEELFGGGSRSQQSTLF